MLTVSWIGFITAFSAGAITAAAAGYSMRRRLKKNLTGRQEAKTEKLPPIEEKYGEFLSGIGHEIRTPLNSVLGMAEILLRTELTQEQREGINTIKHSGETLLRIISDVIDISKIESGKAVPEKIDFDLETVLENMVKPFIPGAGERGIDISLRIEENATGCYRGDPERIGQIVQNLLSNALKNTEKGYIKITASFTNERAAGGESHRPLRISIEDTGIGIPPDRLEGIFGNFSCGGRTFAHEKRGTGLGLYLCARLVSLLGGNISVSSASGAGSTFSFTLPLERGDPSRIPLQQPRVCRPISRDKAARVLLVEDNQINAKVATKFLTSRQHRVLTATDGELAIEKLRNETVDLVLMDVEMPGMNGLEACKRIRKGEAGEENTRVPIVAMTAYTDQEARNGCFQAGMNDYITKPVNFYELNRIIHRIITNEHTGFIPELTENIQSRETTLLNRQAALHRMGGDEELLRELFEIFYEEIPQRLGAMEEAYIDMDFAQLSRLAHSLKGTASTIGAENCSSLALNLEKASKEGKRGEVNLYFDRLSEELDSLSQSLSTFFHTD